MLPNAIHYLRAVTHRVTQVGSCTSAEARLASASAELLDLFSRTLYQSMATPILMTSPS